LAEIDRRADEGQDRDQREREGYGNVAATRRGNAARGAAKAKNKDMGSGHHGVTTAIEFNRAIRRGLECEVSRTIEIERSL
jgi:hypothetical protein